MASVSGEAEPMASLLGEVEPTLGVRRGGANPQRSDEAELAHLGVGWSYSRALDCSDESMFDDY